MPNKAYFLCVDTSHQRFSLVSAKEKQFDWQAIVGKQERYAERIFAYLSIQGVQAADLAGVVIMQGQGSFSETRSAVVLGNLLAEFSSSPVLSLPTSDASDVSVWLNAVDLIASGKGKASVTADYYAPPSITKAKS